MPVQDRVVGWFLKNFIIPKSQILDKPGFVVMNITARQSDVWLRELILPEIFFVRLEMEIVKEFGEKGKELLYSAGKKFGYRYMDSCNFPKISKLTQKDFEKFVYILIRYTESTYANNMQYTADLKRNKIEFDLDNYVICNKSGLGYFLTSGGAAGIWSCINENPDIEAVQHACQGLGSKVCKLICAPREVLEKRNLAFIPNNNMGGLELDSRYKKINEIQLIKGKSFQELLNAKYFTYEKGIIMRNDIRYFLCVISGLYLLEREFNGNQKAEDILQKVSYDVGAEIAKKEHPKEDMTFISDFLSSLGFGEVNVIKKENKYFVVFRHFPWTKFAEDSKFLFVRGLLSGLLSEFRNKEITFKYFEKNISLGYFTLTISE